MTSPAVVYKDLVIVGGADERSAPGLAGRYPRLRCAQRAVTLVFPYHSSSRRIRLQYMAEDCMDLHGAANNWAGMTVDVKRGIVFVPTGSAASDFYGANRLETILFANCLIALNADTGKRIWHFQFVHHDIWDRDLPSPPALVTVKRNGQDVDAVAQTTKQGWVFLFDRETGKPLFPMENPATIRRRTRGRGDCERAAATIAAGSFRAAES